MPPMSMDYGYILDSFGKSGKGSYGGSSGKSGKGSSSKGGKGSSGKSGKGSDGYGKGSDAIVNCHLAFNHLSFR